MVGAARLVTDAEGEFSITIPRDIEASVRSGLRALRFDGFSGEDREELSGLAHEIEEFAIRMGGKIEISARPLVRPEAVCRSYSVAYGEEVLRFPYSNRQGEVLYVDPGELNFLGSIAGPVAASDEFLSSDETLPDGHFAFERPLSQFIWNQDDRSQWVFAIWRLLGQEVSVNKLNDEVPFCSSEGRPSECSRITSDIDSELIRQVTQSVARITGVMRTASTRRGWRSPNRLSFMWERQSSRNVGYMKNLILGLPRTRYLCASSLVPDGCTSFEYPKAALEKHFKDMAAGRLSRDLPEVRRAHSLERYKIRSVFSRIGDRYVACP